ncbi:Dynamin family-domain-containing protein [Mycena polygramma]|nr:Dynamin family-domain-containing protein [Mycena polygramma]
MNKRGLEDDSGSDLTDLDGDEDEDWTVSHPVNVRDFVIPAAQELAKLVEAFPNIPHEQQRVWARAVSRLQAQSSVPSYKFALIGKTGAGKSTLLNCLLGESILPSSAAGACTSAITEISYEDSDEITATILFKSKKELEEEFTELLDDINNLDALESAKSRDRLLMIYPQLENKDMTAVTVAQLMKMEPVKNRPGTTHKVPPSDPDNFRTNLEDYLSSSTGNSTAALLWPLVRKVDVRGRFPVLATGIILVDLPGHGDNDDSRNNFAAEYIKSADGVVLVTDAKRAQNDRDTMAYLNKMLTQIILDGRSVEDFVVLAATGTDTVIGDREIRLEGDAQLEVDKLIKDLQGLRQSLHPPKKAKKKVTKPNPKRDAHIESQIREREKAKALLLANARILGVRSSIESSFRKFMVGFAPDRNEIPRLPIFCLGSQDFLAINSYCSPTVFSDEKQTEIPMLKKHLRATGDRRRISWASRMLTDMAVLSENVHSYFSEGRHPGRIQPENKRMALDVIERLEKTNLQEAEDAFDAVDDEVNRVKDELKKATQKAAETGPNVMNAFSTLHHQTYKACMRYNGVYYAHDMNRDLTREILPAIQGSWNGGINHKIPRTFKEATKKMNETSLAAVSDIVRILNGQGTAFEGPIDSARQALGIDGLLSDMLAEAIRTVSLAQRDGTRSFNTVLQQELTPQYQASFHEAGAGAFARMKKSNAWYLEQNGEAAFNSINIHIAKLLDDAVSRIKNVVRAELHNLTTLLRVSLVEEVNLAQDHKAAKDKIIQVTLDNRPAIVTRRMDLDDWMRMSQSVEA